MGEVSGPHALFTAPSLPVRGPGTPTSEALQRQQRRPVWLLQQPPSHRGRMRPHLQLRFWPLVPPTEASRRRTTLKRKWSGKFRIPRRRCLQDAGRGCAIKGKFYYSRMGHPPERR